MTCMAVIVVLSVLGVIAWNKEKALELVFKVKDSVLNFLPNLKSSS